jgi:hypothetical protein
MDFAKAFSFVFDDQDWIKKIGIGGIVSLVPILNFAAAGYALDVTRRVINNDPNPLPEWDDLGGKLVKGLLVAVIGFVYMLPVILLSCVMAVPLSILGDSSGSQDAEGLVAVLSSCFGCVAFLYSLFAGLVLPAAIGNYAAKGEVSAAFRFGDVFGLVQKNLGLYVMVLVILFVASFVGGLGAIACVIGALFTQFYSYLVMGHATGQAYRESSSNIGLI